MHLIAKKYQFYLSVSLKYQLLLNSWEKRNNASLLFGPNASVLLAESATHQKFKTGFYAGIRFDFKKKNTLDLGIDLMLTPLFKNPNLNRSFANRVHSILLRMGFSL